MSKATYFLAKSAVRVIQKINSVYSKINVFHLRGEFKQLGRNALIENPSSIMNPHCISIGDNFTARSGLKLRAYTSYEDVAFTPVLTIGNNVHLATDCTINCTHRIDIRDNAALGAGSKVMDHMHGLPGYEDLQIHVMKRVLTSKGGVTIKENVMVGAGVLILAGVEIGENCVIGAHAVVTKSIPANSIAVGAPARVIKTIRVPNEPTQ